jgi:biotin synthase
MTMKRQTSHAAVPPQRLSRREIIAALKSRGDEQRLLHKAAFEVKQQVYGNGVMLRGVIEVTNVCRVNCDYCPMRRDNNRSNDKFFMSAADIVAHAKNIRDAGIDIVLLQGGETPKAAAAALEAIPGILELFNNSAEIILNLGSLGSSYYQQSKEAGATSYILKHETSSASLHAALRHEELAYRTREWYLAREAGLKMGTGIISGLPGQDYSALADEIIFMRTMAPDMVSVSPFVPAPDTPLAESSAGDVDDALNFLALTRLEHPYALIPSVSALEKNAAGGQSRGIEAGANVMTINFTGQLSSNYLIYGKDRFVVKVEHVRKVLSAAGARPVRSVYV